MNSTTQNPISKAELTGQILKLFSLIEEVRSAYPAKPNLPGYANYSVQYNHEASPPFKVPRMQVSGFVVRQLAIALPQAAAKHAGDIPEIDPSQRLVAHYDRLFQLIDLISITCVCENDYFRLQTYIHKA